MESLIQDGANGYLLPVAENHVVDVLPVHKDAIVRLYEDKAISMLCVKNL